MTTDESLVLQFMQSNADAWYSRKEISRRAVSRAEFEANPQWATAALARLVGDHTLETNASGLYRIAPPQSSNIRNL